MECYGEAGGPPLRAGHHVSQRSLLQRRFGIARALAAEPAFIICDEVTSALDQLVAEGILRLLDRLQNDLDIAYMFITHDLATVRSIADEVVVMKEGRVVEQGPKDEMFKPPHHPYTDLLLSSAPETDPDWLTTLLEERGVDNLGEAASTQSISRKNGYRFCEKGMR